MPSRRLVARRYAIAASAGAGGFGEVFRARDQVSRRTVAVKLFFPRPAGAFAADAARGEFLLAAAIRHPHVAAPLDLGVDEATGRAFMVSEWAPGRDLDREPRLRSDQLALARVAAQALSALDAAHRHGFAHLDVKPANLRVAFDSGSSSARVILLDFGLARRIDSLPAEPAARPVGSPPYAAPEIAKGDPVDGRADLYGLGVALLRVLAGSPGALEKRLSSERPADGVPEPFASFLPSLLAREPAARAPNAAAARDALLALAPDAAGADDAAADSGPPFAGRDAALAEIVDGLRDDRSRPGPPVLIAVIGDVGSGRTRLLDEARVLLQADSRSSPRPVLVSAEDAPARPGAFLGALVRALRAVASDSDDAPARRGDADPALASLLAVAGSVPARAGTVDDGTDASPLDLAAALARLAAAAARRAPVAILLDDPDRADALSRAVVRAFLRLVHAEPDVGGETDAKAADSSSSPVALAVAVAGGPEMLDFADAPPRLRRKVVALEPLPRDAIRAIAAFALPGADSAVLDRLATDVEARSGGNARLAVELCRAAAAAAPDAESQAGLSLDRLEIPRALPALLAKRLAAAPAEIRPLLRDLALLEATAPLPLRRALGHGAPAEAAARRHGFVRDDGRGGLGLASGALADAVSRDLAADASGTRARHAAIARALDKAGGDAAAIALHALRGGLPDAPRLALGAAADLAARRLPSDAARLLAEAIPLAALPADERLARRADQGRAHLDAGETAAAAEAFAEALRDAKDGAAADVERARLGLAEAERRRGDPARALAVLAAAGPGALVRAAAASIEIERGEPLAATTTVREALDGGGPLPARTRARLENLLGIAAIRLGRTDEAARALEAARSLAAEARDDETLASVLTNSGVLYYRDARLDLAEERHREALALAQRTARPAREAAARNNLALVLRDRGRLDDAADLLLEAFRLRDRIADAHGAASSLANLAAVERERGRLARAIALGERATLRLAPPLDAPRDRALAAFHLGLARLAAGDPEGALEAAAAAEAAAAPRGCADEAAAARVLRFRARSHAGPASPAERAAALADAAALAASGAARALRVETDLGLAETLLAAGDDDAAHDLALRAEEAARGAMRDASLRARLVVLAARRIPDAERLARLRALGRDAASSERPELAFRALAALADAERGAGRRAEAERAARRARAALRAIEDSLPARSLDRFRASPRRASEIALLAAVENDLRPTALGGARPSLDVVRRILAVNRRILEAESEGSLLEGILDGAVALSGAERGLVILLEGDSLAVKVARPPAAAVSGKSGSAAEGVSKGIVLRAIETGKPVVVKDAASDARFRSRASVAERRLSSVAALPLLAARGGGGGGGKGGARAPIGALYLDNRTVPGLFTDEAVEILEGFADQATLALLAFRHRAESEVLRRRLESEAASSREEAARARARLATHGDETFHGIRGRSAAMRAVFALSRRAAATTLPVLVSGESGTGKEAIALAIHLESPRGKAGRPFVTVDCASLADSVLESELFGHVKGAFTSATEDARGLLFSADGGTLLLDGVDELSPAAQAKLLRAIETGEARPVGADAPVRADVRILATTRADLSSRIAAGAFRADLFYRLEGITIALPPLRERIEDLPALAEDALRDAAADRGLGGEGPRRIEPDALRALLDYAWPGNVRELLSEIRRAALLAEGEAIRRADLSRRVTAHRIGGAVGDERDAGSLGSLRRGRGREASANRKSPRKDLDAALRRTEREMLEEVLRAAAGNQSEAARRLGLSRFGLRKKLMRCGLLPPPPGARGARSD